MSLQVECKTFYQLDTFKTPSYSSNFNNGIHKLTVFQMVEILGEALHTDFTVE